MITLNEAISAGKDLSITLWVVVAYCFFISLFYVGVSLWYSIL